MQGYMQFRVVVFHTSSEHKYDAADSYEFLCTRDGAWFLYHILVRLLEFKHVEVYTLDGSKLEPEKGFSHIVGYTL